MTSVPILFLCKPVMRGSDKVAGSLFGGLLLIGEVTLGRTLR